VAEREYVFEGKRVTLPVTVRDASSASATYLVSAAAAQALIAPEDLVVAQVAPGRTLFSVAAIDYRDNDLGDYNEVSLAFFVHARSANGGRGRLPGRLANAAAFLRSRLPTYIHRLPVNQSFTCAAGRGIWGFPKTIEQIDFEKTETRSRCTLVCDGRHVLTLSMARGGGTRIPDAEMITYSRIDGATHSTRFVSGAEGVGIHLGGATLELGTHPIADELRSLGLPKRPLLGVWMEHMHGRFDAPVRV
jgi:hypothetical protein